MIESSQYVKNMKGCETKHIAFAYEGDVCY